MHLFLISV